MIFPDLRALDTHIKAGALLPVYLLYGEENRQIEAARDRLVKTIVPEGDSMNLLRRQRRRGRLGRHCRPAMVDELYPRAQVRRGG